MAQSPEILQIEQIDKGLVTLDGNLTKVSESYLKLVKTIADSSQVIKDNAVSVTNLGNAQKKTKDNSAELDALDKKLIASEQRLKDLEDQRTRATIENNVAIQKKTASIKQEIIIQNAQKGSYEQINAALNNNIAKYKQLTEAERLNASQGGKLLTTIKSQDAALKQLDAQMGRSQRNVGNYASAMGGVGKSLMGAFGIVGGVYLFATALKDTFGRIKEFDSAMQNMAGIAGTSRKDLSAVEEEIKRVASVSVKTSNEVAQLAEVLFTLGKTKQDVINMLEPVNNLAIGLQTTSDNAAELLGMTLNAFGKSSESAKEYADIIANMRTSTALDFQRIKEALGYLAPTAKTVGLTLGQTGAIIGTLQDNGVEAARAGALMNTAFARLVGKGLTLNEALIKISESTNKVETASDLFGKRAFGLGVILADNQEKIKKLGDEFDNLSDGSLKKLTDEQLKSLDARIKILDSTWEKFLLDMDSGNGIIGTVVKGFVDGLALMISGLADLGKSWGEVATEIAAAAVVAAEKDSLAAALINDKKEVENISKSLQEKGVPALEANKRAAQGLILQYERLIGFGANNAESLKKQVTVLKEYQESLDKKSQSEQNAASAAEKAAAKAATAAEKAAAKAATAADIAKAKSISEKINEQEKIIEKSLKNQEKLDDEGLNYVIHNDIKEIVADLKAKDEELQNLVSFKKKYKIISEDAMNDEIALMEQSKEWSKLTEEEKQKALKAIKDRYAKEDKQRNKELRDAETETAIKAVDALFTLNGYSLDKQLNSLEVEKNAKLSNAKLTADQKAKIEEEYVKKENAIKTKQAKNEKLQALFSIALSTAKGAMDAASKVATLPLVPWIIAMGAIEAALVVARPIPKFAKGIASAPERGILGEEGRELMFLRSGETLLADKPTYFEGNKFKGATIKSNPVTEKMLASNEYMVGGRQIADDRILKGLSNVENAIRNKPVMIFDTEHKPIGQAYSHHQTIYLNKLTRNN